MSQLPPPPAAPAPAAPSAPPPAAAKPPPAPPPPPPPASGGGGAATNPEGGSNKRNKILQIVGGLLLGYGLLSLLYNFLFGDKVQVIEVVKDEALWPCPREEPEPCDGREIKEDSELTTMMRNDIKQQFNMIWESVRCLHRA
ncbi:uncharacterized protein LOC142974187 [Anticarsia gemmatalis]|uniref:uncharacterized protein LOC142974187 n=1 Tax=Anticarsia gemmatalis TaxID=129554 RepID=UPI003F770845